MRDGGRLVLVADARIDNRAELAAALGMRRAAEVRDGDVILEAYERWGSGCVAHLVGDFAIAIWDRRRSTLFCARDPMGVKPFYYHQAGTSFAFASEIKALLCLPGVPCIVDHDAVARYIACVHDDREQTRYRGIRRLPAASILTIGRSGFTRSIWWRATDARDVRFASREQYAEAFGEIFSEAVRARMQSDRRVGTTLSGGLDSSSVACVARKLMPTTTLPTFSLVFPSLPHDELERIDERPYIDSVARAPGFEAHLVRGDLVSPLNDMARMLRHLDEPHIAPNLYLHCALYAAARDNGVGVLLDGFDGDATISHGFGRLNSLLASGDLSAFAREAHAFAGHRNRPPESVLPHFGFPFLASLARRGQVRPWLRVARGLTQRFPISRRELITKHGITPAIQRILGNTVPNPVHAATVSVLRPALARSVAGALRNADAEALEMATVDERAMHLDTIGQPLYQLTLEIADKAAAAFGIEPRYPFFDRRLIEFCVGLPEDEKFSAGWPRHLFRRAMEGILPAQIQWRATKGNLAPNFDRQLRTRDRAVVDAACEQATALERYVVPGALRATARRYFSGTSWGDPEGMLLMRTTMLSHWLPTVGQRPTNPESTISGHQLGTPMRLPDATGVCLTT